MSLQLSKVFLYGLGTPFIFMDTPLVIIYPICDAAVNMAKCTFKTGKAKTCDFSRRNACSLPQSLELRQGRFTNDGAAAPGVKYTP